MRMYFITFHTLKLPIIYYTYMYIMSYIFYKAMNVRGRTRNIKKQLAMVKK